MAVKKDCFFFFFLFVCAHTIQYDAMQGHDTNLLVGNKGLENKVLEGACGRANLNGAVHFLVDPRLCGVKVQLDLDEAELATALDELVGLGDKALLGQKRMGLLHLFPRVAFAKAGNEDVVFSRAALGQVLGKQALAIDLVDGLGTHDSAQCKSQNKSKE